MVANACDKERPMAGFFDKLKSMGAAHLQHVEAIRSALQTADTQAARDTLASYLKGLSGASLAGFRISIGALMGSEGNPQVRQALQWVQANIDALREGQFAAVTPQTLPRHGLSLQQVTALIEPWVELSQQQAQQQFIATMGSLDAQGRQEFAAHCDTLAMQAQQQLQQLQDNESSTWGTSWEDRMSYLQASIRSGQSDPAHAQAVAQQQGLVDALIEMAQAARLWQDAPQSQSPAPDPPSAPAAPSPEARNAPIDMSDFPAGGSPSEQMAFMRSVLGREKARGQMDPARAAALTDFVDHMTSYLRAEEERQRNTAVDPNDRAALEASLRERMSHVAGMRERMDRFADMHRDIRRNEAAPAGTRAAAVRSHVGTLIDDVYGLRSGQVLSTRKSEAQALEALHTELIGARARVDELASSDEDVLRYETDTLRPCAHSLRQFHRRGHAMVARPIWPGGAARVEPSSVIFVGPDALLPAVAGACTSRRLELRAPRQAGVDQATWLWRGVQRAGVAVVDLSDAAPQTYYQLGQAYALGTELLLMARAGTHIPFDVAQFVLSYRDEDELTEQLPSALDATLYGVQTHGLSALMHSTLQRCRDLAAKAAGLDLAGVLLSQLEATVQQPVDFRAALEQFLGQMGNSRLVLLQPRWPAHYPAVDQKRCFVVMPFSQQLTTTQAIYRHIDADLRAAGVEVVRGDEALGQEIVASIWEETARASHVLVDLTNYNLNVCLELGMADTIGRDTLLIGANGTSDRRFAAIDKRRIHHYGDDDASQQALRAQVRAFAQRAATLQ
jgi:hypothetical protein